MKKLLITVMMSLFFMTSCEEKKEYCGKISEKYLLNTNRGHFNIVIYCDSLQRYINVKVSANCYVNNQVGENICFELTKLEANP